MKKCTHCNETKELVNFNKRSVSKDGLQSWCKPCDKKKKETYLFKNKLTTKEYQAKYYIEKKDKLSEYSKAKYLEKRDEILAKSKAYAEKTKESKALYDKEYRKKKAEKIAEYKRQWAIDNADKIAEKMRIYRDEKVKKLRIQKSEYAKRNKERINAKKSIYEKRRRATEPLYRLKKNTRKMVSRYMVNGKSMRTQEIIGCTYEELKLHIEQQFTEGMTWENYGINGWHIDHIKPLAMASTEEEIVVSNHYTNLQPLWCLDNLSKGATFEGVNYKTKQ